MRISVLSTMVDALRRNISRGTKDVALFEHGLVVAADGPAPSPPSSPVGVHPSDEVLAQIRASVPPQPRHLGVLMAGERQPSGWWGSGRAADWSDAVEVVRSVAEALAVPVVVAADQPMPFHPGRCARVSLADGTLVGHAGELHPKVLQSLGLPPRVVGAEIDLDVLMAASGGPQISRPLRTLPAAASDVALIVDAAVPAAAVEAALRDGAGALLESLTLFDIYAGDQLEPGHKSLAYRLVFRAPDRTLKTEEVNALRDAAVAAATQATGATQRT